jgi:UDP-4-amino-4,6-dideoxy-N-acetyl-beta-L-altrosamine transaminase
MSIPYGRQDISEEDVAEVAAVLRSDWLTQGPAIERFERAVAEYCGAKHAVAVSNATAALHIACLAAGVGPGDRVWTSPNTFVASANCALYCGAQVDFVDIDPRTYNLSPVALAEKLEKASAAGLLPKLIIPVHFSGQPCDMAAISALAARYGIKVMEDAAHAIGGSYGGKPIGACDRSLAAIFSFHPVKIITTAEGGMVVTNDSAFYEKLKLFRSHGITREPDLMEGASHGPWYYQQIELGFNYRITDIQAALGTSQMRRLDAFVARRRELAARYDAKLAGLPLTLPHQAEDGKSAWHLYVVRLRSDLVRGNHRQIFESLRNAGIGVNLHYIPVHTQPYYRRLGFRAGDFPEAERYYSEAISIPMYSGLSDADQDRVSAALAAALKD